jgi:D-alanine-D-alanine ligase-like ATP-grasp enzyme
LPYAGFIGWDLAVDNNKEIVLVEINASEPGLFQAATGPAFGEYTMDIFNSVK